MRTASRDRLLSERNKGVFLSRTSPEKETKVVGIHRVVPLIKAKEVGSQAV